MADEILLTQEGYDKIVAEHEELVSVRRKERGTPYSRARL